jgi:ribosomal protein S18 acetylase RimI-like enzyme
MDPAPDIALTLHDDVPRDDWRVVDQGLGASNDAAAPLHEVRPLSCFARTRAGRVVGGAIGRTWGECCELLQLWVEPAYRERGVGTRLVHAFEQRAGERGCSTFYLETFSFQAPSLYRALGYETRLELRGFAPGIRKYTMVRFADPASGPTPGRPVTIDVDIRPPGGSSDALWLALRLGLWPDVPADEHRADMAAIAAKPGFVRVAIEQNGKAIGLIEVSIRTDYVNGTLASPVAFIEGLFVVPDARRRGVARRLVAQASAWAATNGWREIASDARIENLVSQAAHRALGFEETERVVYFRRDLR